MKLIELFLHFLTKIALHQSIITVADTQWLGVLVFFCFCFWSPAAVAVCRGLDCWRAFPGLGFCPTGDSADHDPSVAKEMEEAA